MSVEVDVVYEGELRCSAVHKPSQNQIFTDAPVDNHGKGEAFSPTDLVATALGSCVMTIVGIVADRHEIDLQGSKIKVAKHMVSEPVRRIGRLDVNVHFAHFVEDAHKSRLIRAAETCPVKQSLHPDIDVTIQFHWNNG